MSLEFGSLSPSSSDKRDRRLQFAFSLEETHPLVVRLYGVMSRAQIRLQLAVEARKKLQSRKVNSGC